MNLKLTWVEITAFKQLWSDFLPHISHTVHISLLETHLSHFSALHGLSASLLFKCVYLPLWVCGFCECFWVDGCVSGYMHLSDKDVLTRWQMLGLIKQSKSDYTWCDLILKIILLFLLLEILCMIKQIILYEIKLLPTLNSYIHLPSGSYVLLKRIFRPLKGILVNIFQSLSSSCEPHFPRGAQRLH